MPMSPCPEKIITIDEDAKQKIREVLADAVAKSLAKKIIQSINSKDNESNLSNII